MLILHNMASIFLFVSGIESFAEFLLLFSYYLIDIEGFFICFRILSSIILFPEDFFWKTREVQSIQCLSCPERLDAFFLAPVLTIIGVGVFSGRLRSYFLASIINLWNKFIILGVNRAVVLASETRREKHKIIRVNNAIDIYFSNPTEAPQVPWTCHRP